MKPLWLLIVCFCLAGLPAGAQRIRFTDTTNSWNIYMCSFDDATGNKTSCRYLSDTAIQGFQFRRLPGDIGIREDTASGKLYFRILSNISRSVLDGDTAEHLYFDYNLKVGDSIQKSWGRYHFSHGVIALDSIRIGGDFYTVWSLAPSRAGSPGVTPLEYRFIEAIGSLNAPFFPIFPVEYEGCSQVRCFSNRGRFPTCVPALGLPCRISPNLVYHGYYPADSFDNLSSCSFKTVGVGPTPTQATVLVFPNPGGRSMVLQRPSSMRQGVLSLTDVTGRSVCRIPITAERTYIGQYLSTPGVYFYSLQDAVTGKRYTGKFIFQ